MGGSRRRSTLEMVAHRAQVSPSAVSVALSDKRNSTIRLSDDTRRRILEAARELDYRPHGGARSARLQQFHTIGVVTVQPVSTPQATIRSFPPDMVDGINDALVERDYCLSLLRVSHVPTQAHEAWPKMLAEARVDGLVVTDVAPPELQDFIDRVHLPALWVNANLHAEHDCIYYDEVPSAREITRYLVRKGHRRIGFIRTPLGIHYSDVERHEGYLAEMKSYGLAPCDGHDTAMPDDTFEADVAAMLRQPDRPTAMLTANDRQAARLGRVAHALHLRVPRDVSVVTWFTNPDQQASLIPAHTGMVIDNYDVGRLAVETILKRISRNRPVKSQVLPLHLHEGDSVAPPPQQPAEH